MILFCLPWLSGFRTLENLMIFQVMFMQKYNLKLTNFVLQ